jgi:hypothetical protein
MDVKEIASGFRYWTAPQPVLHNGRRRIAEALGVHA